MRMGSALVGEVRMGSALGKVRMGSALVSKCYFLLKHVLNLKAL